MKLGCGESGFGSCVCRSALSHLEWLWPGSQHGTPDPQRWEPPVSTRKNLVKLGCAFILLCRQLCHYCRSFCLAFCIQKKKMMQVNNTPSKWCFLVKGRLHEKLLLLFFEAHLAIRAFFLLFVCHIILDFQSSHQSGNSVLINQAIHTWVWCEKEHYLLSFYPSSPLAGKSSWLIVGFTTLIKLGDDLDFSLGKWDGKGSI